jgi:hypothetical protein
MRLILLSVAVACGLGLALVRSSLAPVATEPTPVFARVKWTGARGDAGNVVFTGLRDGRSVKGWLYVAGREVPVTATVDAAGIWSGQITDSSGMQRGEFAGQLQADGRASGMYTFDGAADVMPSTVSTAGQWEVYTAVGFEERMQE